MGLGAFLALAGATGAFLAFHHEIDAALAPGLHRVSPGEGAPRFDAMAAGAEARHPDLVVGYFVLTPAAEASVKAVMNTRAAAQAGRLDREAAGHVEVYLDPRTARVLGERRWGEPGATRAHVVPMVYRLHTSLFLGTAGQWITGIVAALFLLAMAAGLVLALPRARMLGRVMAVRWRAGRARLLFDLHRAAGVGGFVVLAVLAVTGFYMNLPQLADPVVTAFSPFSGRPPSLREAGVGRAQLWRVGWDAAYASARAAQPEHPLVVLGRVESRGYYQARFMPPDDIMDAGTIRIFVSGRDGAVVGRFEDRKGTAADVIRIWQFPLHSGQAFGLPGRVLVCVAGLVPPLLAATGLWLWLRRRGLRRAGMARPREGSRAG